MRSAPTSSSAPRILLVEDDDGVREGLRRVLAAEGWLVTAVGNVEKSLEHLRQQRTDLLITDLFMAPISGWDLLFHEGLHRPELPIFVISALSGSLSDGADQVACEYFQKPVDLGALVAAVRRHFPNAVSPLKL